MVTSVVDDSYHVAIGEKAPVGAVGRLDYVSVPAFVGHADWWRCEIGVSNIGDEYGWFLIEVTGDVEASLHAYIDPGGGARAAFEGRGPKNFTVRLKTAEWREEDAHEVTVNPTAVAIGEKVPAVRLQKPIAKGFFTPVAEGVGIHPRPRGLQEEPGDYTYHVVVGPSYGPPQGELRNPDFPEAVGPDEDWVGLIECWNIGTSTGITQIRLTGGITDAAVAWVPAGVHVLLGVYWTGPVTFTIHYEMVDSWREDDSREVTMDYLRGPDGEAKGELGDVTVPHCAESAGPWTGSAEMMNVGWVPAEFKIVLTGDLTETLGPFEVPSMGSLIFEWGAEGPKNFTVHLLRKTPDPAWVEDVKLDIDLEGCKDRSITVDFLSTYYPPDHIIYEAPFARFVAGPLDVVMDAHGTAVVRVAPKPYADRRNLTLVWYMGIPHVYNPTDFATSHTFRLKYPPY